MNRPPRLRPDQRSQPSQVRRRGRAAHPVAALGRSLGISLVVSVAVGLVLAAPPAGAAMPAGEGAPECVHPTGDAGARTGWGGLDTPTMTAQQQQAVEREADSRLDRLVGSAQPDKKFSGAEIPVYVHIMRDRAGDGDVTDEQVADQVEMLNQTFAGAESADAARTGFTFTLAGIDRYDNARWHADRQSARYRAETRQGGADALNIWVVDFAYLGVATFPWDVADHGDIDGIRVNVAALPGGAATDYDLGKTATHETGHWLGLYHTFQGGCSDTNDEVADTPAQSGPTNGCPQNRDSCTLPGMDPVHNYMDYSFDSCYDEFTAGQAERMGGMWMAYRAP